MLNSFDLLHEIQDNLFLVTIYGRLGFVQCDFMPPVRLIASPYCIKSFSKRFSGCRSAGGGLKP